MDYLRNQAEGRMGGESKGGVVGGRMFKFRFRIKKGLVPGSPAVYMGLAKVLPRGIGLSQGTPIFGRSSHDCIDRKSVV